MGLSPGKFWGLRRLAGPDGTFRMLAIDQRPPLRELVCKAPGPAKDAAREMAELKAELLRALAGSSSAVLADPAHGLQPALHLAPPAVGLIATLEDSVFSDGGGGRKSAAIKGSLVAQIRDLGADAAKALL